jgi:hypothetical protein
LLHNDDAINDWPEDTFENNPALLEKKETQKMKKETAEKMFCIVMPLAERNMFVALKQERFAGLRLTILYKY